MSYCATNAVARSVCRDRLFWTQKLDYELEYKDARGSIIKPSDYIMKYQHPDQEGWSIYGRWITYGLDTAIKNKYNDIGILDYG